MREKGTTMESRLKDVWENFMQSKATSAPQLVKDWAKYLKHLPTRTLSGTHNDVSGGIKLYTKPYIVRGEDLLDLAIDLHESGAGRKGMSYIVAPSHTGKTSCVLPGFLRSLEDDFCKNRSGKVLTHYLYVPFHNNQLHHKGPKATLDFWQTLPDRDAGIDFETLGSVYMWKCFEKAIQGEYMTHKEAGFDCLKALSEQFKDTNQGEIREKLNGLVKQFLDAENRKQQPHLLIHLDEHRKLLCLDSATENSWREQCGQKFVTAVNEKCANFRRGAWQALTELANTRIIATYVDFPYELPGGTGESSAGCRTAVAKPVLDVAKLMEYLYQLRLPKLLEDICIHAHNKRRLATLQICLGLVLDGENTIQATSQRQSISLAGIWCEDTPSTNFLNEFADLSQKAQSAYEEYGDGNKCLKEMLTSCQKLCKETFQAHCSQLWQANVQDLLDLLLGMPETKVAGRIRAVDSGLISLWGGESLTVSLKVLLNALPFDTDCTKPYRTLFKQCQPCLRDAIFESSDDASTDVCANRILEASYMWTIAMQQYRKHEPNVRVPISGQKFTDVKLDGRIFAVERDQQGLFISVDLQGIRNLRPGVLYRAQDKHQNGTHPWADMWYVEKNESNKNTLILIEITGSQQIVHVRKRQGHLMSMRHFLRNRSGHICAGTQPG